MNSNKIWIESITLVEADAQFEGCNTPDIVAGFNLKPFQPGYPSLGVLDHMLLVRTDTIVGVHVTVLWRVWTEGAWQDLSTVSPHLLERLTKLPVGWQ